MGVDLQNNFPEAKSELNAAIDRAVIRIAERLEYNAAFRCPVDTGRLRNSIKGVPDLEGRRAYVGTNVEYAGYVELGTSKQRAQPYLKPALVTDMDDYVKILSDCLKNIGKS